MCNIAGYTGFRNAAPVLIDMMRREEGFYGGYYTGIVTLHEGKLYSAKVLGDLQTLIDKTDALRLPGKCGLIHSRTPSGGNREWAYPFLSCDRKIGFVENGSLGKYTTPGEFAAAAVALDALGHTMTSATGQDIPKYPHLPSGISVHYSDIQCHLLEEAGKNGLNPAEAMRKMMNDYPCDDVCVSLHADHPGELVVGRYTRPMLLGRGRDEQYIATTPTALPDAGLDGTDLLPANAVSVIRPADTLSAGPIRKELHIEPIGICDKIRAYKLIHQFIAEEGETAFPPIFRKCRSLYPEGTLSQYGAIAYEVLDACLRDGSVKHKQIRVPGMDPGTEAPEERFFPDPDGADKWNF